jgi:hypothetical protein
MVSVQFGKRLFDLVESDVGDRVLKQMDMHERAYSSTYIRSFGGIKYLTLFEHLLPQL